jgi:hypothetical protein
MQINPYKIYWSRTTCPIWTRYGLMNKLRPAVNKQGQTYGSRNIAVDAACADPNHSASSHVLALRGASQGNSTWRARVKQAR